MKLSEKVFEFENEISGEYFALEVKSEIDKLETLKEVKDYYLYERGWIDSDSMVESLIDFIIYLVKE
jgi:hypothetical protein